jgi:hypothetical protein
MLQASPPVLTTRQKQVVELIADGCSNEEVGERLGISPRTAKAHCDVLRQKLGGRATEANPARVPRTDRRRSALKGLAPGRSGSGGLTAPHPWPFAVAGAACLYPTVVNRCRAH